MNVEIVSDVPSTMSYSLHAMMFLAPGRSEILSAPTNYPRKPWQIDNPNLVKYAFCSVSCIITAKTDLICEFVRNLWLLGSNWFPYKVKGDHTQCSLGFFI